MRLLRLELRTLFFIVLGMTLLFANVIRDPDFYFHLKAGADILHNGAIPTADPYTFTHAGGAWHAHEWLFELLIYLLHDNFGPAGVNLFIAVMGMAALYIASAALSRRHPLELLFITATALLLTPFLAPRPQLFTYLFFATYLFALLRYKYRGEQYHLWGLPLLMVVWVNVHGGYLLGVAIIVAFIASEALAARLTPQEKPLRLWPLLITLLAVVGATLLNPWGIAHWRFPFELMGNGAMAYISEWQPLDFKSLLTRAYLALLAVLFIVYLNAPRRPTLSELLIPWTAIAASFTAARHMPLALLALLPFLILKMNEWIAAPAFTTHPVVAWLRERLGKGGELGAREYLFNWAILALLLLLFAIGYPRFHADDERKLNALLPAAATDFILASGLSGRMFNTYHYGGYLIYRLAPRQQVFIDIRADMFGAGLIDDYRNAYLAAPGWEAILDRYAIDYLVCESSAPLLQAAVASGRFVTVYSDETSSIAVRDTERYRPLITAYHPATP